MFSCLFILVFRMACVNIISILFFIFKNSDYDNDQKQTIYRDLKEMISAVPCCLGAEHRHIGAAGRTA